MNCSVTILIGNTWVMKTTDWPAGNCYHLSVPGYHRRQASSSMVCLYTALSFALKVLKGVNPLWVK